MNWLDKPDGDGLWWYCNATGEVSLWLAVGHNFTLVKAKCGRFVHDLSPQRFSGTGKFHRCELTPPEPYVAPKPPKVEMYTAKFRQDGSLRFLVKVGGSFIATTEHGEVCGGRYWGGSDMELYTDITPCELANT